MQLRRRRSLLSLLLYGQLIGVQETGDDFAWRWLLFSSSLDVKHPAAVRHEEIPNYNLKAKSEAVQGIEPVAVVVPQTLRVEQRQNFGLLLEP